VQQVAVSRVDLDQVQPDPNRSHGRGDESLPDIE
jgi:hypothetical protein